MPGSGPRSLDLGRDGRPFTWTVWPSDTPPDLAARLVAAGFEDEGAGPVMARDLADPTGLDEPPPVGLVVREATSESEVAAIAAFALGSARRRRPRRDDLRRDAGARRQRGASRGCACSAAGWTTRSSPPAALFTGSGVAGIYAVATDEAHRGRGFGRALTVAAMAAGRDAGLDTTVLLASELGEPVYRRLGYRAVGEVRFLRWPGRLASRQRRAYGRVHERRDAAPGRHLRAALAGRGRRDPVAGRPVDPDRLRRAGRVLRPPDDPGRAGPRLVAVRSWSWPGCSAWRPSV